MKDTILNINLETSTAPIIQEVMGKDYIEYGTDDYGRNLYPQFLIDLYYNSSTHAAIINSTAEMIAGENLIIENDDTNLDIYVKLQKFLKHANGKESLHQVIKKVAFDFKLQGAYALHIIWNQERTEIAELYHVPVERVRAGVPNELGHVDTFFISSNWAKERENPPHAIAAFNSNDRTSASQLLYSGLYSPNMDIYHTPDYNCQNWALVDQKVAEFHLNNISNSFSGSYLFSFNNGTPTQEERFQIEQSIKEKFTGSQAAGRFVLCFSEDRNRAPEITPLNTADLDKQYLALQELLVQNICSGHRVTSKTLMGIDTTNGFSSNADELVNASNFYQNSVVRPFQLNILNTLQTIFSVNNMDLEVDFVQLKPITVQFDSKTIREVMTRDEVRMDVGLSPLNMDEETVSEESEELSKVGMEATQLSKFEKTELENFIMKFGEDEPTDWILVDKIDSTGEHQDFDFEDVLNNMVADKLNLASTGTARPNSKSSQDGVNASYSDYYKVRYRYAQDTSLSQEGETREFCKIMSQADKRYRKEDIVQMEYLEVNKGWGPKGDSNTYSIWLNDCKHHEFYKGGGNCHHYWERLIYKTSLRNAKKNISDRQIIDAAVAESEGFTLEREDSKVAQAPKTMPNEGFINK